MQDNNTIIIHTSDVTKSSNKDYNLIKKIEKNSEKNLNLELK